MMTDCDISVIAGELNARSSRFEIGGLQQLRKEIKGLGRLSCKYIFSGRSTHDEYAFHSGGRTELQFNIGKDGPCDWTLRHGIAFSFQTSRSLHSIEDLKPKVDHFNQFLRDNPGEYADMRMWHCSIKGSEGQWSDEYLPGPIPTERVRNGVFVFLGKCVPTNELDYDQILADFDRLLPLYRYVEST